MKLLDFIMFQTLLDKRLQEVYVDWVYITILAVLLEFCSKKEEVFVVDVHAEDIGVVLLVEDSAGFDVTEFGSGHEWSLLVIIFCSK